LIVSTQYRLNHLPEVYLVGVHDAEGFLELLDGTLGEHGEDIASALLCFPKS